MRVFIRIFVSEEIEDGSNDPLTGDAGRLAENLIAVPHVQ